MDAKKIKKLYKECLNKSFGKYEYNKFLGVLESEFIELLNDNSEIKIYDGFLPVDNDGFEFFDLDDEYFYLDDEYKDINRLERDIRLSYDIFGEDYLNELIGIFKNKVMEIKEHLHSIRKLIDHSKINQNQYNSISIKSTSDIVSMYFKKYHQENVFELNWRNLSSGEYSFLGFLSRFYKVSREIYRHRHILIVIDEGELYFHPQWQKKYVFILIKALNHIFSDRKIQVVLTSHSPFIISDLPHYSVELINKSKIKKPNEALGFVKTFAANIQDLYANAFFLQGGLTGEFSRYRINEAIQEIVLKPEQAFLNQDKYFKLFSLIGEPLVKEKSIDLLRRYISPYEKNSKREEIQYLKERIKKLEKEL